MNPSNLSPASGMPWRKAALALAVLGLPAGGSTQAWATQTDNYGLRAVPTPGKVTIDGKLDDWDRSGAIPMCYDLESLKDVYSAEVSAMYDADNLYIGINWTDPTPLGNSHDPRYQANKGWAGDCVQLRIKTDRIAHVTAWYYGPKDEPAIQISYGQGLTKPFGGGEIQLFRTEGNKLQRGAEMGFKKNPDGRGYVQEIKLPWGLITESKKYGPGDSFNCGFELLWGEADWPTHRYADNMMEGSSSREFFFTNIPAWGPLFLEPRGNLKLPEPAYMVAYRTAQAGPASEGAVPITYKLPKDARVTIAIEDTQGNRVRNLISALPRKKGENTEKWDGMDEKGKPVPPGEYRFKGLFHDGIRVNYALSFANPGNPSWETPDGRGAFYGDHSSAQGCAAAGDFVALACPVSEAGKHVIGVNLDGQRLWGLPNRVTFDGGRVSLATDGKILWVANEGRESSIYRVEIATGKYAPWKRLQKNAQGEEFNVLDLPVSAEPGKSSKPELGFNLTAIAVQGERLAVALRRENKVKFIHSETGDVLSEVSVEAPVGCAFAPDGSLLVLSGGSLKKVGRDGVTAVGTLSYPDAFGVTVDNAGQIYVTVGGQDNNVKVISPAGTLVREIGERGGRLNHGPYKPLAMRDPGQPAIDSKGRLWVPEQTKNPKRTSVWDTATGTLLKDIAGTTTYAGAGAINPYDPTMGFSDDAVYRLDWEKGSYTPVYSIGSRGEEDIFPPSIHQLTSRVVKRGNLTYVFTNDSARGSREVHCTLFDGKEWRSVFHMGTVRAGDKRGAYAKYQRPLFAGQEGKMYSWTDQNGDGLPQPAEMTFSTLQVDGAPTELLSFYWGQLPDQDGTIPYMVKDKPALAKFAITGVNSVGAPIYDITKPEIVTMKRDLRGGNGEGMLIGGKNGRVYLNQDPLIAVEKDGTVTGGYPNGNTSVHGSHSATAARPGYLIGPSSFLGVADMGNEIGEVFNLNGNLGESYLFTGDGLWIQSLFKDTRGFFETPSQAVRNMPLDAATAGGESFGGNFVRTPDGKTYLTIGGTDARVIQVSGLDTIKRLEGKFRYTAPQYAQAQQLAQGKAAQLNKPRVYDVMRAEGETAVTIDGRSQEWAELTANDSSLLEIQETPTRRYGRVQARYDETNLYLGYRVLAYRNAMKNAGQDMRLLFKSGDAVDLMLGPGDKASKDGHLRILISAPGGKMTAVINQKTAPSAPASEKFSFASPWRSIPFDRVAVLNNVQLASSAIAGGYFVEAAIPWAELGVKPTPGLKLSADVGVLLADTGGTTTVARHYWSNKATGLVNDVPGEADLTPNLWGTWTLAP